MKEYLFNTDKEIMTCQECPIVKKYGLSTICPLREGAERKYGTCPLVEVPTHGDLVNREDVLDAMNEEIVPKGVFLSDIYKALDVVPIVIEASNEEGQGD